MRRQNFSCALPLVSCWSPLKSTFIQPPKLFCNYYACLLSFHPCCCSHWRRFRPHRAGQTGRLRFHRPVSLSNMPSEGSLGPYEGVGRSQQVPCHCRLLGQG
ncbi:hypothetical protein GALMADRAFT_1198076 [Galerina marginata CBS 339.88]|uniref:Uncharacterized protein n=1 Tax=Galerina marginata (strain CBS 339.88) TaxID=685588 RepID=A0A067TKI9_GALM3|nr:hypothetical protein GALMADRAFT_1198076 [Galerina marginata CBS 339.88]